MQSGLKNVVTQLLIQEILTSRTALFSKLQFTEVFRNRLGKFIF